MAAYARGVSLADRLEHARPKVEATLLDHCQITADPQAFADDTFDETTLTWTRPGGDTSLAYDDVCAIRHESGQIGEMGGADMLEGVWTARILLLGSAAVVQGAVLTVTASRDPGMVGRTFKVDEIIGGTFKLTRRLRLSSITLSTRERSDR